MGGMIVPSWFCYSPTPLSLSNCAVIHLYTECRWDHLFSWKCLHWYSLDSLNTSWNLADWNMRKLFWISGQKWGSLRDLFTTSEFLCLGEDRVITSFLTFHTKAPLVTSFALGVTSHLTDLVFTSKMSLASQMRRGVLSIQITLERSWEVSAKFPSKKQVSKKPTLKIFIPRHQS